MVTLFINVKGFIFKYVCVGVEVGPVTTFFYTRSSLIDYLKELEVSIEDICNYMLKIRKTENKIMFLKWRF